MLFCYFCLPVPQSSPELHQISPASQQLKWNANISWTCFCMRWLFGTRVTRTKPPKWLFLVHFIRIFWPRANVVIPLLREKKSLPFLSARGPSPPHGPGQFIAARVSNPGSSGFPMRHSRNDKIVVVRQIGVAARYRCFVSILYVNRLTWLRRIEIIGLRIA